MANTVIQLKHSTETGNVPSSLANGEISINSRDGKFFYSTPSNVVVTHYPYPGPAGLNQEVQFNDSGVLGSDSGLTYNKTTDVLTVTGGAIIGGVNVTPQIQLAFTQANAAFSQANNESGVNDTQNNSITVALNTSNASFTVANAAFLQANTPSHVANSAASYANGAFSTANAALVHANAAFAQANTGTSGANSFGVIYTANNNTFANATTANAQLNFIGESGVVVFANSTTKTITVAGTPGAQGLTVDYGFVYESINYSIDYGTL